MKKRDALGCPPKQKELRRLIVQILKTTTRKALATTEPVSVHQPLLKTPPLNCCYCCMGCGPINEVSLKTYVDDLEDCIRRNEILPDDLADFDKKGFMMGRGGEEE